MNYCIKCGFENVEEAAFCAKCGNKINTQTSSSLPDNNETNYYSNDTSNTQNKPVYRVNVNYDEYDDEDYEVASTEKEVVTPMGYIGRALFNLIPIAGPLVYFILLFVWSNDEDKEDSFRNWAKAQLWLITIFLGILLVILLFYLFFAIIAVGGMRSLTYY